MPSIPPVIAAAAVVFAATTAGCTDSDDDVPATVPARTELEPPFAQAEPGPVAPGERFVLDFDGGPSEATFILLTPDGDDWRPMYRMTSDRNGAPAAERLGRSFTSTLQEVSFEGPLTFVMPDDLGPGRVLFCDAGMELNCLEMVVGDPA